jgi:hypothetical protein
MEVGNDAMTQERAFAYVRESPKLPSGPSLHVLGWLAHAHARTHTHTPWWQSLPATEWGQAS